MQNQPKKLASIQPKLPFQPVGQPRQSFPAPPMMMPQQFYGAPSPRFLMLSPNPAQMMVRPASPNFLARPPGVANNNRAPSCQSMRIVESRGDSAMSCTSCPPPPDGGRASTSALSNAMKRLDKETKIETESDDEDDPFDDTMTCSTSSLEFDPEGEDDDDDDIEPRSKSGTKRPLDLPGPSASNAAKKPKSDSPSDSSFSMPFIFPRFGFGRRRFGFFGRSFGRKKAAPKKPVGDGGKRKPTKPWSELTTSGRATRLKGFFQSITDDLMKKFSTEAYTERLPENPIAKISLKIEFENGTSRQFNSEKKQAASKPSSGSSFFDV